MTRRPAALPLFPLFMRYWLPVLVYVTIVITLSAQPHLTPPPQLPFGDKFYHFGEYLLLGFLLVRAIRASFRIQRAIVAALLALSLGIVIGTGDEVFQSTVPGRESSAFDLLADIAGIAVAQMLVLVFARD